MQRLKIRHMWKIYGRTALNLRKIHSSNIIYKLLRTRTYNGRSRTRPVLSTVHLRQYNLNVRGAVLPTSYMVGVATHPAARRGGVGGALLTATLEETS